MNRELARRGEDLKAVSLLCLRLVKIIEREGTDNSLALPALRTLEPSYS